MEPEIKETTELKLRRQIAEAEAKLDLLRAKLGKIVAKKSGEKAPLTGLDLLWDAALPISRNRSSKFKCRAAWNQIPIADRPTVEDLVNALKVWNRSPEWKKDGNAYAIGLDRFIRERRWESLPETEKAPSRYRTAPPQIKKTESDAVTNAAEIAELLNLKPRRMQS